MSHVRLRFTCLEQPGEIVMAQWLLGKITNKMIIIQSAIQKAILFQYDL